MKFNWFKKEKTLAEAVIEFTAIMEEKPEEVYEFGWTEAGPQLNGLPIVVADDDFFEYLAEEGYGESIEYDDLIFMYQDWEAENVESIEAFCVKCKETNSIKDLVVRTNTSGRQMAMGFCPKCNQKVNKILDTRV